jgi:tRNA-dihydrouridine synthase
LDIYEKERPVGIQIFGANEESMLRSVEIVEASKPDIIDINFGCPVKKVVSKGAGAGILKDIPLMVRLTKANGRTHQTSNYSENPFGMGSRFHKNC